MLPLQQHRTAQQRQHPLTMHLRRMMMIFRSKASVNKVNADRKPRKTSFPSFIMMLLNIIHGNSAGTFSLKPYNTFGGLRQRQRFFYGFDRWKKSKTFFVQERERKKFSSLILGGGSNIFSLPMEGACHKNSAQRNNYSARNHATTLDEEVAAQAKSGIASYKTQ